MLFPFFPLLLLCLLVEAIPIPTGGSSTGGSTGGSTVKKIPDTAGQDDGTKLVQKAIIIVGFPGVGKSWLMNEADKNGGEYKKMKVYDESGYSKGKMESFLESLIPLAKEHVIILTPAHRDVGNFLIENKLYFTSVYPESDDTTKEIYLQEYIDRKEREAEKNGKDVEAARKAGKVFSDLIRKNWVVFQKNMHFKSKYATQLELHEKTPKGKLKGMDALEHLMDVMPQILRDNAART